MNPMEQRFAGLFPFERATGHFFYSSQSDLSILMQDLKYRHYRNLARKLGEIVGRELSTTSFLNDMDYIVPIPIHFIKRARRGYNQTEEIAYGFSKATDLKINTDLTVVKPHRTQTKLTLDQRRRNTKNIFRLKPDSKLISLNTGSNLNPSAKKSPHILLLDDVCTTGSTITSAAETILASSPSIRLSILTIGCTF